MKIVLKFFLILFLAVSIFLLLLYLLFQLFNYLAKPRDLKQSKINGQKLSSIKNKTVITVVAHPDDVDWYTGGTLSVLHKNGNRVIVVVGTSGEKGGSGMPKLNKIREKEQIRAGEILGYDKVIFLRHPDRGLKPGSKFKSQLENIFKEYKPDILFTFDTEKEGYIYRHADHEAAGEASTEVAKDFPGIKTAYLFHSSRPNTIVDVSSVIKLKEKAMSVHQSQRNSRARRIFRFIPIRPTSSGSAQDYPKIGIKNGEAFRLFRL